MRRTFSRVRTTFSAQRRTAWSTVWASGHVKTDELNDLTGIADSLLAPQRAGVRKWRPFWMAIRIAGWMEKRVFRHQHGGGQLAKKLGDDMPPRLLPQVEVQRLDSFSPRKYMKRMRGGRLHRRAERALQHAEHLLEAVVRFYRERGDDTLFREDEAETREE